MENFNYWKYREAIPRIKVEEDGGGGRGGGRGRGGTTTTTTTNEDGTGKETVFQPTSHPWTKEIISLCNLTKTLQLQIAFLHFHKHGSIPTSLTWNTWENTSVRNLQKWIRTFTGKYQYQGRQGKHLNCD
ncbi:hypothetical protein RUM44_009481 [Polyplax serrata]|uniref:Uncharacterized protein n=1 Tax=Polyplax serrata TaxID=468196 RepID=A0ABR1ASU6_POLSC